VHFVHARVHVRPCVPPSKPCRSVGRFLSARFPLAQLRPHVGIARILVLGSHRWCLPPPGNRRGIVLLLFLLPPRRSSFLMCRLPPVRLYPRTPRRTEHIVLQKLRIPHCHPRRLESLSQRREVRIHEPNKRIASILHPHRLHLHPHLVFYKVSPILRCVPQQVRRRPRRRTSLLVRHAMNHHNRHALRHLTFSPGRCYPENRISVLWQTTYQL